VRFETADEDVPVFPTIASQFNDPGISWMFVQMCRLLAAKLGLDADQWSPGIDVSEPVATSLRSPEDP
jgi:methylmalonyl-CoA mutase